MRVKYRSDPETGIAPKIRYTTKRSILRAKNIVQREGNTEIDFSQIASRDDAQTANSRYHIQDLDFLPQRKPWAFALHYGKREISVLSTIDAVLTDVNVRLGGGHAQWGEFRLPTGSIGESMDQRTYDVDEDINLVADGGETISLTEDECVALDRVIGNGFVEIEIDVEPPASVFGHHTAYLVVNDQRIELPAPSSSTNTDEPLSADNPHYTVYDLGEYELTIRTDVSSPVWLNTATIMCRVRKV